MMRMAQYGTKHGHAAGKLRSMLAHPDVSVVGVFEPDVQRRKSLQESDSAYAHVHWFASEEEMLGDSSIVAIASEGSNAESLDQTESIVDSGKHTWYDKPAGEDWVQWQRVMKRAQDQKLLVQMGYMFRYHDGYRKIAEWVHSGFLGDLFEVRAHMSTSLGVAQREVIAVHQGGIFFDLAGHQLDQVVWLLGRPERVTAFLRDETKAVAGFCDNTLGVFEFKRAMALVDIAAIAVRPTARRFEVYGTMGSAIMEPMEPADHIRLCLDEARGGYVAGEQRVAIDIQSRQKLYDLELNAFLSAIAGTAKPDRSYDHELLVQETLLRATGKI